MIFFRKFYIPGVFSLVGIMLFLYYFTTFQNRNFRVVDVVMLENIKQVNKSELILKITGYESIKINRKIIEIILNGKNDIPKITKAQILIRKMISENDSIKGLKFTFTNNSTYNSFVKIINVLLIENAKRYAISENNIYFFKDYKKIEELIPVNMCGTGMMEAFEREQELKRKQNIENFKKYCYLLIFPVSLFILFFINLRRKN